MEKLPNGKFPKIPKLKNSQIEEFLNGKIPKLQNSQMGKFPNNSQMGNLHIENSQMAKFPNNAN